MHLVALSISALLTGNLHVERTFVLVFLVHLFVPDGCLDLLEAVVHEFFAPSLQLIKLETLLLNHSCLLEHTILVTLFEFFVLERL